jgi:hypothetical protein
MDAKLANLKAEMDLTRTWIHVDMDAFFASVEELDDPSLVRIIMSRLQYFLNSCHHLQSDCQVSMFTVLRVICF